MSKISFRSMLHKDDDEEKKSRTGKKGKSPGKKSDKSKSKSRTDTRKEPEPKPSGPPGRSQAKKSKKEKGPAPEKESGQASSNQAERKKSVSKEDDKKKEEQKSTVMSISELIAVQPVPEVNSEQAIKKEEESVPEPNSQSTSSSTASISSLFRIEHNEINVPQEDSELYKDQASDEEYASEEDGLSELVLETDEYQSDQIITFLLGTEEYGLNILDAREVKQILPLTPIPRSPDWVLGIVNLRGMVFPVVDLKKRLNIESEKEYPISLRRIIVVEIDETKIGLLVDRIHRIFNKHLLDFSTPPALISGGEDFISAIAKKDELIISIISVSKLFTSEEKELLAKIKEEKT